MIPFAFVFFLTHAISEGLIHKVAQDSIKSTSLTSLPTWNCCGIATNEESNASDMAGRTAASVRAIWLSVSWMGVRPVILPTAPVPHQWGTATEQNCFSTMPSAPVAVPCWHLNSVPSVLRVSMHCLIWSHVNSSCTGRVTKLLWTSDTLSFDFLYKLILLASNQIPWILMGPESAKSCGIHVAPCRNC